MVTVINFTCAFPLTYVCREKGLYASMYNSSSKTTDFLFMWKNLLKRKMPLPLTIF